MATLASAFPAGISDAASSADERATALDKAIPLALERASVPGVIVGIWQDGSEPYVRAFGVRDTATVEKMAPDLFMRIGSNSKTFTVTAILMLAEQKATARSMASRSRTRTAGSAITATS